MNSLKDSKFAIRCQKKTGKANRQYDLISAGDKILVGLSGGRDSLALLHILQNRRNTWPIHFDLLALHVNISELDYAADIQYLKEVCSRMEIPLETVELNTGIQLNDTSKTPCFLCSWNRRKALFDYAGKHGYNKVALGHHMDDILETYFMNMIFHAELSTMPPKLHMFDQSLSIIRPLCLLTDKEVKRYAAIHELVSKNQACQYENQTRRNKMKEMVRQLSLMDKKAKFNMYHALENRLDEYLPNIVKTEHNQS